MGGHKQTFKPKCWANLFKDFCFVLVVCLLVHRLAVRISFSFHILYKLLLYWSRSTAGRSGTTQRFFAVDLLAMLLQLSRLYCLTRAVSSKIRREGTFHESTVKWKKSSEKDTIRSSLAPDFIYSLFLIKICSYRQNQENWSEGSDLSNKGTHLGLTRGVQSSLFGSHLKDGTRAAWPKLKRAIGDGMPQRPLSSFPSPFVLLSRFSR